MKAQNKFAKLVFLVITGSLLLSLSTLATAESDAVRAIRASANVPTNIPGVYTYAEPPKGFNPVTAADVDLATYGFPPRPDKQSDPDGYAVWERVVKAAKIHWNGELKPLPTHGHGMIPAGSSPMSQAPQPQAAGPQQIATVNTSGVVLTNKLTSWNKNSSFAAVYASFSVPTPALPYGVTCSPPSSYGVGAEEYSLVGIDNLFASDGVEGSNLAFEPGLAGGVYELSGCGAGDAAALAVFGYFWPGYSGQRYAAFNPSIGDVFFVDVFATGPNNAYVFLSDLTTYTAAEYSVSTPGLIGQNVAWMVSRSCCDNDTLYGTNQLANTANVFFGNGYAATAKETATGKFTYYPGSQAASTLILTMTDDKGDGSIETVTQGSAGNEGLHALSFTTVGCAYSNGCIP
jgi:hypothetical protein